VTHPSDISSPSPAALSDNAMADYDEEIPDEEKVRSYSTPKPYTPKPYTSCSSPLPPSVESEDASFSVIRPYSAPAPTSPPTNTPPMLVTTPTVFSLPELTIIRHCGRTDQDRLGLHCQLSAWRVQRSLQRYQPPALVTESLYSPCPFSVLLSSFVCPIPSTHARSPPTAQALP
jgi:hypothetical protein